MEGTEVTDGPEDSELWLAVNEEGWELCCCVDVTYTKDLRKNVFDFWVGRPEQVQETLGNFIWKLLQHLFYANKDAEMNRK